MATKTLTGACLCGKITYAIDLPATEPTPKIILCHCTSCKRYTGGGFSTNIMIPKSSLRYTSATSPKVFLDSATDSGYLLPREICGDCGCHFTSAPEGPNTALKWGTLDEEFRVGAEVLGEIYCKRRDGWVDGIGKEGGGNGQFRLEGGMA
ncbi:Mss4-like protein [Aspergillus cavernicola]|uniref:Mss4-like protein n=1 Tax=Aspergillus cavernicola TaxID=176166 RepID=A0ABR4IAG1_9EURO